MSPPSEFPWYFALRAAEAAWLQQFDIGAHAAQDLDHANAGRIDTDVAQHQFGARHDGGVMLRTPHFKYTRYDDGGSELYDLARDPDELENQVETAGYADVAAQLKRELADWERRYPHRA